MNKEKPQGTNYRFYRKQIRKVKAAAKKLTKAEGKKVSEAEVARRAVDNFNPAIPLGIPVRKLRKMLKVTK
jgi:hypothetical protein